MILQSPASVFQRSGYMPDEKENFSLKREKKRVISSEKAQAPKLQKHFCV
jgi:hypothetical protein